MPFDDSAFDRAMMLHVGMNIADKAALMREAARVLEPGGLFCVYDMMRVRQGPYIPASLGLGRLGQCRESQQAYIDAAAQAGLVLGSA